MAFGLKAVGACMNRQNLNATVQQYLVGFLAVAQNTILVVASMGDFGVETTSFADLVAGADVPIGAAWGGLLGNFASGIFLLVLRPYQVGVYFNIGGVEGKVIEVIEQLQCARFHLI